MVLPPGSLCSTSKFTFHRTFKIKQLSTIPGTDSRMKAEHYPRVISLVPSMLTISNHKSYGPISCHIMFPLSIFTFRGVLLEVRLSYQSVVHMGASTNILKCSKGSVRDNKAQL